MTNETTGEDQGPEQIDIETQIGRVVIDIDGKAKDENTTTIFIHMIKLPKLLKAILPDSGNFKVDMPRSLVRRYGQKLLDLSEA